MTKLMRAYLIKQDRERMKNPKIQEFANKLPGFEFDPKQKRIRRKKKP